MNFITYEVAITNAYLSKLKNGKVTVVRFDTLSAICKALDCQPGNILEYQEDELFNLQTQ